MSAALRELRGLGYPAAADALLEGADAFDVLRDIESSRREGDFDTPGEADDVIARAFAAVDRYARGSGL